MILAVSIAVGAPTAWAHETQVPTTTVIDDVDLDGIDLDVEIIRGLSDQLLLRNQDTAVVEVLDDDGDAFLRIGPDGVDANLGQLSWYESNDPLGVVTADPGVRDDTAPDEWEQVSTDPVWALFDHRLHPGDLDLPGQTDEEVTIADWTIPLRAELDPSGGSVDGGSVDGAVRGRIVFRPVLGLYRPGLSAGVDDSRFIAQLIPEAVPAFFLRVLEPVEVVVDGVDGRPFLRFGPDGVEANLASPSWLDHVRLSQLDLPTVPVDPGGEPVWEQVSEAPSFTWLDPRAASDTDDAPADATTSTVTGEWSVPLSVDGEPAELVGFTRWVPLPQAPAADDGGFDWTRLALLSALAAVAAIAASQAWTAMARRRSGTRS